MAYSLRAEDFEERIDCFGEFDRGDRVCLSHCGMNFECAAAKERYQDYQLLDDTLVSLGCAHSA